MVAVAVAFYANNQRIVAEASSAEAEAQRTIAEQLAFDARSDALAASSIVQLDADPELALLLATVALQREPQPLAVSATHQALQRHRTLFQIAMPEPNVRLAIGATGGMNPAGDLLAVATQAQDVEVWEIGGDAPLWTLQYPPESTVLSARFTDDGSAVVVLVAWLPDDFFEVFAGGVRFGDDARDQPLPSEEPTRPPEAPLGPYVFDATTGDEFGSIPIPECPFLLSPSPLPEYVNLTAPFPWVTAEPCTRGNVEIGLLDPQSGSFTAITEVSPGNETGRALFGVPTTDSDGRFLAVGSGGPGQVIELATGDVVFRHAGGISTLSADGSRLLRGGHHARFPLELWDLAGKERLWFFPKTFTRAWFSGDEQRVYGTSLDGSTYVLDAASGEPIMRLEEQSGVPVTATMSQNGRRLATFATDFTARVWDIGATRSEGATYVTNSPPREHMAASAALAGGVAAVWGGAPYQENALWETTVFDLETGETLSTVTGGSPALSPDGTRLAYRVVDRVAATAEDLKGRGEPGEYARVGAVRIIDVATGDLIVEIDLPCPSENFTARSQAALAELPVAFDLLLDAEAVPLAECTLIFGTLDWNLEFSPDGMMLAMADSHNDIMMIWDAGTGAVVAHYEGPGANRMAMAFTPDQEQIAVLLTGELFQRLFVYDLDSFEVVKSIPVGGATFAEMVFTPDGSLLVAASNVGNLALFDAITWDPLASIAAHDGAALDVAINPAGTLIASGGEDAYIRVWNIADRSLLTEISFEVDEIANVEFIDDTHLFVTPGYGSEAIVITLDPDELLRTARTRLTRSFTNEECAIYEIDPCPTLDDIKSP